MKLNNQSYCHKRIRLLCFQLEALTDMKLVTNLSEEFDQVRFVGRLGYLIINFERNVCFALSHKITKDEQKVIEDIVVSLQWLETGRKIEKERCFRGGKK